MKAIKIASPIPQECANPTVAYVNREILQYLGIRSNNASVLGSIRNKNPQRPSGDIDFAVDKKVLCLRNNVQDPFSFVVQKMKQVSPEVKDLRSMGIVSAAIPMFDGNGHVIADKFAQLDIMLVDNVKMAEWFYYSPSHLQSKYKGVYRTIFLSVIASIVRMTVTKYYQETPVIWNRLFLEPSGLYFGSQTILSPKTHRPTVTRRTLNKELVTDVPSEVLKEILGPMAGMRDTESFERILTFIRSDKFHKPEFRNVIFGRLKAVYEDAKLIMPKELKNNVR